MELTNQHVFITGGSSGIGLAIARQAAAKGARLTLLARDPVKLSTAAATIRNETPTAVEILTLTADVSVESDVQDALRAAELVHGPVEVLIASAGIACPGYFEKIPVSVFERSMAVNYFGTLYAIKAVARGMCARRRGSVVIISSGAGLVGLFGYTAYSPSKFALRGLAESLRAELRPQGIAVTIIYPPDTFTPQLIEENQTKPIETKAITTQGGLWSADSVAKVILTGVQKQKFSVTPGIRLTLLAFFHSAITPLLHWSFDRAARNAKANSVRKKSKV